MAWVISGVVIVSLVLLWLFLPRLRARRKGGNQVYVVDIGGNTLITTDHAEAIAAARAATGEPEVDIRAIESFVRRALSSRLCGDESLSRAIIDRYWIDELYPLVAEKVRQTLVDGTAHNFAVMYGANGSMVALSVDTISGKFMTASGRLKGNYLPSLIGAFSLLEEKAGSQPDVSIGVAFFVEDDDPKDYSMYCAAAVTFVPRVPNRIPSNLHFLLVHTELLSDMDMQRLRDLV